MFVVRFVLLIVHAVVVLLLLGTFATAYIPPKVFPWANFLSLIYPILLAVHLALILIWFMMWRKRAFLFLLATVFCIYPIQRWVNYTPKSNEKPNFKVVSLNAHAGREGEENINRFFNEQSPEVFFVQEAGYINEHSTFKDYYKTNNAEYLHIYTKCPILHSGVIYEEEGSAAKAIYADVECHGLTLRLINFYLEPFQLDRAEKQAENIDEGYLNKFVIVFKRHQKQVNVINEAIKSSPYPVIVAGDMNAVPNSYEYYKISEGLLDSFQVSGMGIGTTFPETIMPIKIDYILSSPSIKPVISRVYKDRRLSDHYPIITEFEIK